MKRRTKQLDEFYNTSDSDSSEAGNGKDATAAERQDENEIDAGGENEIDASICGCCQTPPKDEVGGKLAAGDMSSASSDSNDAGASGEVVLAGDGAVEEDDLDAFLAAQVSVLLSHRKRR